MSNNVYKAEIKPSYIQLRSIYLGTDAMQNPSLKSGRVIVLIENNDDFIIEGTLNPQGYLTGMSKLYRELQLKEGSSISFSISDTGNLIVTSYKNPSSSKASTSQAASVAIPPIPTGQTIFERQNFKHIHIEPFRPENLNNWEPETETDVYLAFGVLQDYTDFQYCCGASANLLKRLGAIMTNHQSQTQS